MSKPKLGRAVGRGSILMISLLLLGSAAMRIAMGAGAAVAQGDLGDALALPMTSKSVQPPTSEPAKRDIQSLLDALQEREARVEEREIALDVRAKAIEIAKFEAQRRIDALQEIEVQLRSTLAQAETAAEDDVARLTTVYENMKPKDAAALFGAMEPEFAAGFLARMRPDAAAKVMSGLDPRVAYSISAILAGRNARAPKN